MARFAVFLEDWPAASEPRLIRRLMKLTGRDQAAIERKLTRRPVRLAKSMGHERVRKLKAYFEQIGAELTIEPVDAAVTAIEVPPHGSTVTAHQAVSGVIPATEAYSFTPSEAPALVSSPDDGQAPVTAVDAVTLSLSDRWRGALYRMGSVFPVLLAASLVVGLGAAVLLLVVMIVGGLLLGLGIEAAAGAGSLANVLSSGGGLAIMLAALLIWAVADGWLGAVFLASPAGLLSRGERAPLGWMLRDGARRLAPVFVTGAVVLVLTALPLVLLATLLGATAMMSSAVGWLAVPLLVAVGLALIGLSLPTVAVEAIGPLRAIGRGWRLAVGQRLSLGLDMFLWLLLAAGLLGGAYWLGALLPAALWARVAAALLQVIAVVVVSYLWVDLLHSHYAQGRVVQEGWKPGWMETLHASWPLGHSPESPPAGRGLRGWAEMGLVLVLLFALVAGIGAAAFKWMAVRVADGLGADVASAPAPTRAAVEPVPEPATPAIDTEFNQPSLLMEVGQFFDNAPSPSVWLQMTLDMPQTLPAALNVEKLLSVEINDVRTGDDRSIYAPNASTEGPFSHKVRLVATDEPGQFSGTRNVTLKAGTREDQVALIEGAAVLHWPAGLQELVITPGQLGQAIQVGDLRVKLDKFNGPRATLIFSGRQAELRYLGVMGDVGGRPVQPRSSLFNSSGDLYRTTVEFDQPPERLRLWVPARMVEYRKHILVSRDAAVESLLTPAGW